MKSFIFLAGIILPIFLFSCSKDHIRGNGNIITEQRTIAPFTHVHTNADINVHIIYGTEQKITVKGYENLVAITETRLSNHTLIINYDNNYYNVRNSNVEVFIEMPVLTELYTNGSADMWANGFASGTNIFAHSNGSGDINITNSTYTNAELNINGNGKINAQGLNSLSADAAIAGSGDIEVSCSQFLNARISGSGDISYWGNPVVTVNISGSGTVRKR